MPVPHVPDADEPVAPTPVSYRPSEGDHVWLALSWIGFLLTIALPFVVVFILLSVAGLTELAALCILHTGGFALVPAQFSLAAQIGIGLALLVGALSLLRLLSSRGRIRRQRIIGPGGRVVGSVQEQAPGEAPAKWLPWPLRWLSHPWPLLGACAGWVLLDWDGRLPLAAMVAVALLLAVWQLALLVPVRVAWWQLHLNWRVYRYARTTGFRAGLFTAFFGLLTVAAVHGWLVLPRFVPKTLASPLESAPDLVEFERRTLLTVADRFWPEETFAAGVQRFLRPLLDAAGAPDELAEWRPPRALPALLLGTAHADPDTADPFGACIGSLYPSTVNRAQRRVLYQYRLSEARSYDLALGVLIKICEKHALHSPYPNLEAAYWRAIGNDALKQIDPRRKHQREVSESALYSDRIDCQDREDLYASCPTPGATSDDRYEAWERIAQVKWCSLSRLHRAILLEKAVQGDTDAEIAAKHGLTAERVKNTYQNVRRKVKNELDGACPLRTGWPDLLDGLR